MPAFMNFLFLIFLLLFFLITPHRQTQTIGPHLDAIKKQRQGLGFVLNLMIGHHRDHPTGFLMGL
jgi:hypothetical protein